MNRKRILSLIMAFCMVLSLLPMDVLAVEWPQAVTRANVPQRGTDAPSLVDGYYEIYNADQLYWFAEQVNGGRTSINGKLMADIVVNENVLNADGELNGDGSNFRVWTPIGNSSKKYSGTFDGNGKTVSGLYFNDTTRNYVGLFGYVGEGGTVENVGVIDSYLKGNDCVGGVVGLSYYSPVTNCYNTGIVSGADRVGGVVGRKYCYSISKCYNTGSVSGRGMMVGGVVGENESAGIHDCYNTGNVSSGTYYAGGVVGYAFGSASGCYNIGSVNGGYYVGGVVGYEKSSSSIYRNCYYLSGCARDGAGTVQFGVGNRTKGSTTADRADEMVGQSSAQFASGEVAYLLQGVRTEYIWGQAIGTDPYPVLGGEMVFFGNGSYNNPDIPIINNGYYEISSASQLYWFAAKVNGGDTAINGKLMTDIVIDDDFPSWIPIGNSNMGYAGTFDGSNHSIKGMKVYTSHCGDAAMFKNIAADGIVKNLTIADSYFGGGDYKASSFAVINSGVLLNCVNAGTVYSTEFGAGGIVCSNSGRIENCMNVGSVGTIGFMNSSSGGIANFNSGSIVNCINTASVEGHWTAGGLVASNSGTLSNCYNTGYVEGIHAVGGLVGSNSGTIMNCYNTGSVFAHSNSVPYDDGCGGVAGCHRSGTISNCYYLINCAIAGDGVIQNGIGKDVVDGSTSDVSGITTGVTTEQFASGEVAYLLQGDQTEQIWGQDIGTDDYPVLGGERICKNSSTYYNCVGTWLAATCTEPKTCSLCGVTSGSALGHVWAEATCTKSSTCTTCGATTGNALGHSWVDATCTTPKTCTVCGGTTGNALGHSWSDATCTTAKTCTVCGVTEGDLGEHSYMSGICSVCGEEEPASNGWVEIDPSQIAASDIIAITITKSDGKTYVLPNKSVSKNPAATLVSIEDGALITEDVDSVSWNVSVTDNGMIIYVAGSTSTWLYSVHANAGVGIGTGASNTWTIDGDYLKNTSTRRYLCVYNAQDWRNYTTSTTTNAANQILKFWKLTAPSDEEQVCEHTYDEGVVTAPTCTVAGFTAYTCTKCGESYNDNVVEAIGHSWSDATCTTAKTCTVCGTTSGNPLGHRWAAATCTEPKTCTVCGATTGTALGHSWKAATCTAPKICAHCGLTEGNPLGHRWAEATCTAPKTCTTCGATTGKALGHIEVVIPGYGATYYAPGLTEGSYCSRCGDTLREQQVIDPIPEEITFSYQAYGINGSTNAVNSGYITLEIWMNVNTDIARAWGADIGLSFNENLTLLEVQGGIFEEDLATPLHIANSYNAVKITQDMVLGDDKTFTKGQYLFATLTFKVDKNFHSQNAAFLVDVDECAMIRKGDFANELVTDFGTGTNIHISKLGDANLDGKITAADTMALSTWLQNADLDAYNAVFDLNKDGYIDGDDFALLRGAIVWDNGYLDI